MENLILSVVQEVLLVALLLSIVFKVDSVMIQEIQILAFLKMHIVGMIQDGHKHFGLTKILKAVFVLIVLGLDVIEYLEPQQVMHVVEMILLRILLQLTVMVIP